MSFNFPNAPIEGQTYTPVGGYQYVFTDGKWRVVESPQVRATAETRSRIVNGAMQISQENGDTGTSVSGGFGADQWMLNSGGITSAFYHAASVNALGLDNPHYIAWYPNPAKPTLTGNDFVLIDTKIEGTRISDFRWGTASARQVVLRFDFQAGRAGVYCVALQNTGGGGRSYIAEFTVTAGQVGVMVTRTFVIPGDTVGTSAINTAIGIQLTICMAGIGTYAGVPGWQAGPKFFTANQVNSAQTVVTNVLTNVGLYLDPDATGLAPKWQMPDEAQELLACQRYYYRRTANIIGYGTASTLAGQFNSHPVPMRVAPAMGSTSGTFNNASSLGQSPADTLGFRTYMSITAAGTGFLDSYIQIANARM